MFKSLFRVVAGCVLCVSAVVAAQMPDFPTGERVDADAALNRALKASSLTNDGKPFRAVVEIGKPGEEYSGRVEVWWSAPNTYRLQISSPKFSQTKVVSGEKVWEKDDGDYYPLPVLSVEQMRTQMRGCPTVQVPAGTPIVTERVSVDERGNNTGEGNFREGVASETTIAVVGTLFSCEFVPYVVNGKPTYYHGDVVVVRR